MGTSGLTNSGAHCYLNLSARNRSHRPRLRHVFAFGAAWRTDANRRMPTRAKPRPRAARPRTSRRLSAEVDLVRTKETHLTSTSRYLGRAHSVDPVATAKWQHQGCAHGLLYRCLDRKPREIEPRRATLVASKRRSRTLITYRTVARNICRNRAGQPIGHLDFGRLVATFPARTLRRHIAASRISSPRRVGRNSNRHF